MKKIISGISFLFFGLILYLTVHIQASDYLPQVTEWPTSRGKWWAALNETHGLLPTYIGVAFCVLGVVFTLWGSFEDEIKTVQIEKKTRNRTE